MKQKKALATTQVSLRNRVAQNPLIRKGGAHQQSNKAKRQAQKMAMKKREFERGAVITAIGSNSLFFKVCSVIFNVVYLNAVNTPNAASA